MKKWLQITRRIDALNERVGQGISWLTLLLVVIVVIDVFVRYLLNDAAAWVMELEWYVFTLLFMLGAGYSFRHDRHVRVDLFYSRFGMKDKALVNLVGGAFLLLPWLAVLIWSTAKFAHQSWQIGEGSPDPGGLPARYLIKAVIPVGLTLLFLQGLADCIRNWARFRYGYDYARDTEEKSDSPITAP